MPNTQDNLEPLSGWDMHMQKLESELEEELQVRAAENAAREKAKAAKAEALVAAFESHLGYAPRFTTARAELVRLIAEVLP